MLIVDRDNYQFIIILSGSDSLQNKGYGETWDIDDFPAFEAPYTLNYYFERQAPPDTIVAKIYNICELPKKSYKGCFSTRQKIIIIVKQI